MPKHTATLRTLQQLGNCGNDANKNVILVWFEGLQV